MITRLINKISNLTYLIIIGLTILLAFYGLYFNLINDNDYILNIGSSLFVLSGLMLILKYSRLIYENKHIRVIYILIGFLFIGSIFKIMHYPGFEIIFIGCSLGFIITYIHRYLKKDNRMYLDHLKILWVLINYSSAILMELKINIGYYINTLGVIFFVYLFSQFWIENKDLIKIKK